MASTTIDSKTATAGSATEGVPLPVAPIPVAAGLDAMPALEVIVPFGPYRLPDTHTHEPASSPALPPPFPEGVCEIRRGQHAAVTIMPSFWLRSKSLSIPSLKPMDPKGILKIFILCGLGFAECARVDDDLSKSEEWKTAYSVHSLRFHMYSLAEAISELRIRHKGWLYWHGYLYRIPEAFWPTVEGMQTDLAKWEQQTLREKGMDEKSGIHMSGNWNEYNLNPLTRINWRASLVPAAAIPILAPRKKVIDAVEDFLGSPINFATDRNNCETKGVVCPPGFECVNGISTPIPSKDMPAPIPKDVPGATPSGSTKAIPSADASSSCSLQ